jgi:hypothetical protein
MSAIVLVQPGGRGTDSGLAIRCLLPGHEHISHVWWANQATGEEGNSTRPQIIEWIERDNGRAYLDDGHGSYTAVLVVAPRTGEKYLQTCADGILTDTLLSLPRK